MQFRNILLAGGLLAAFGAAEASAQGYLTSANGLVAIGVNDTGNLNIDATGLGGPATINAGPLGIAYNFSGQGGRTGWQDALSPGCLCEAWGVSTGGLNSASVSASNPSTGTVSRRGGLRQGPRPRSGHRR